ncbi:hypothetical protein EAO28_21325 [Klebsiella pneumoniae]|uniref:Alanine--tRNA ligase n=1 Tax=Klebsiella pneumoniae TaxID=573 RepID=A0A3P2EHK0_KLEPN|nr:hypothetical protein EAO28_21325 [Klebsiella pneumoniae]RRF76800.1 hypothetical protein EAO18_25220 [Klebsiella pneumoniae]
MSKSTAEIRQAFLDFFHSKGHQVVASSSRCRTTIRPCCLPMQG